MCDNIQGYVVGLVIEQDDDGTFYAFCPGLKGVNEFGDTVKEARQNAVESIELIMKVRHERGEPLPESEFITIIRKPTAPTLLRTNFDSTFYFPVHPEILKKTIGNEQRY